MEIFEQINFKRIFLNIEICRNASFVFTSLQKKQFLLKGSFMQYVRKIFQKPNISYPPDTHTYVESIVSIIKKERTQKIQRNDSDMRQNMKKWKITLSCSRALPSTNNFWYWCFPSPIGQGKFAIFILRISFVSCEGDFTWTIMLIILSKLAFLHVCDRYPLIYISYSQNV